MLFPKRHAEDPVFLPLLFLHIPKTAGTSLRYSMEARLGRGRILNDYGRESSATSVEIKEGIYENSSPSRLEDLMSHAFSGEKIALAGHFRLSRYARFFAPERTIAVVRDPLQRAASEYLHKIRSKECECSFAEFFAMEEMTNRQAKLLGEL